MFVVDRAEAVEHLHAIRLTIVPMQAMLKPLGRLRSLEEAIGSETPPSRDDTAAAVRGIADLVQGAFPDAAEQLRDLAIRVAGPWRADPDRPG